MFSSNALRKLLIDNIFKSREKKCFDDDSSSDPPSGLVYTEEPTPSLTCTKTEQYWKSCAESKGLFL